MCRHILIVVFIILIVLSAGVVAGSFVLQKGMFTVSKSPPSIIQRFDAQVENKNIVEDCTEFDTIMEQKPKPFTPLVQLTRVYRPGALPVHIRDSVDKIVRELLVQINQINHYSLHFLAYDVVVVETDRYERQKYKLSFFVHDSYNNASRCLVSHVVLEHGKMYVNMLKTWAKSPKVEWTSPTIVDFRDTPSTLQGQALDTGDTTSPKEVDSEREFLVNNRCGGFPENRIQFAWDTTGVQLTNVIVQDGGFNYATSKRPIVPTDRPGRSVIPRSSQGSQFDLSRGIMGFP